MISINDYVQGRISRYYTKLELYKYESFEFGEDTIHPEVVVPSPIEVFVSDWNISKIILPDTLQALDIWFDDIFELEFNIPSKIEEIVFINANILNKNIMELFPKNLRYNYSDSYLNSTPIYTCVYNLYTKYFPKECISDPKNDLNHEEYMSHPKNSLNSINYRYDSRYINEIREYEARIAQGRAFRLAIKEELVAAVWHPDKVEKLINAYGIDFLDTL
jgi:hypothetical protein